MTNSEKYKSAKERAEAFREFCRDKKLHDCRDPIKCNECHFDWLDLEAPAEKPLPCPFCGHEVKARECTYEEDRFIVECSECEYTSASFDSDQSAIAAHNRVARAAKTNLQ